MISLDEYPRPQLERESYICLNGYWDYVFSSFKEFPTTFEGKILVPFSPETKPSGVNKFLKPGDCLFYQRVLDFPKDFVKDKVILHFGAVDQIAEVFVNDSFVGTHVGGFLPFSFDIKPFLKDGENLLKVRVQDFTNESAHSVGKQNLNPGGIFYPAQSGIYMPVWIESVNEGYIEKITFTPDVDNSEIHVKVHSFCKTATIFIDNQKIEIESNIDNVIKLKNVHLWSPEDPYLYYVKIENEVDSVKSYFAMRKVSLIEENGIKKIALNNKPYFIKGVLDQGYYKEGLLTPQSDEDYINDIKLIKNLGFNTSRKHIKIESLRWYYHADRLGLLVWQDFVNACTKFDFFLNQVPLIVPYKINDHKYKKFYRENEEGRKESYNEFLETIDYLYNCPSIIEWTIFNEAWGQFDSKEIYEKLKLIDKTRLFDHASGWHDQGSGDFKSKHIYKIKIKNPRKSQLKDRAYVVSECGAYILDIHSKDKKKKGLIYSVFNNKDDFEKEYERFITKEIIPAYKKGMSAFIYTQLSDVEEEKNGFVSYDRKEIKVNIDNIKRINDLITK